MKPFAFIIAQAVTISFALSVQAQGTFQNLNFESATLSSSPPTFPASAPISAALPGWTAYLGDTSVAEILQNNYTTGAPSVDIFGPNSTTSYGNPAIIDGHYSVMLQAGFVNGITPETASIAQSGTLPVGTESIEFKEALNLSSTPFSVTFNGYVLSPVVLATEPDYALYGANISPSDGTTGVLEFTADTGGSGLSEIELDDISFSTSAVPEPSIAALTAIGGLLFGARKWSARR